MTKRINLITKKEICVGSVSKMTKTATINKGFWVGGLWEALTYIWVRRQGVKVVPSLSVSGKYKTIVSSDVVVLPRNIKK